MGTSQWIRREEHALWGLDDHVDPELDLYGSCVRYLIMNICTVTMKAAVFVMCSKEELMLYTTQAGATMVVFSVDSCFVISRLWIIILVPGYSNIWGRLLLYIIASLFPMRIKIRIKQGVVSLLLPVK